MNFRQTVCPTQLAPASVCPAAVCGCCCAQTHRSERTERAPSSADASVRELSASTRAEPRRASPDIREPRQDERMAWLVRQTGSLLGAELSGTADVSKPLPPPSSSCRLQIMPGSGGGDGTGRCGAARRGAAEPVMMLLLLFRFRK